MKLLLGLGNPDPKYTNNRHNVGFLFLDFVEQNLSDLKMTLKKSNKFMNVSGKFVSETLNFYKSDSRDLYIAHDDLDLTLGEHKIQFGVGPKLHGGINSIEEELGTSDFWRIRIGVDSRDPENRMPGEEYVLQDFSKEELDQLKIVFSKIGQELDTLV